MSGKYLFLVRIVIAILVMSIFKISGNAQTATINGGSSTCVIAQKKYTYTLTGSYNGSAITWCVQGGFIESISGQGTISYNCATGTMIYSINVIWTVAGPGRINVTWGNNPYLDQTVFAALSPGAISNTSQTINYYTVPAKITCSSASGGACSPNYNYQWESSSNGTVWTATSITTTDLSFTKALIEKTYFRRKVTETITGSVEYTFPTAMVDVNPPFCTTTIVSSQDIFTGTVPASIIAPAATGGNCNGNYTYLWESSSNGIDWIPTTITTKDISFSNPFTATTYYRRRAKCAFDEYSFSNSCKINVYQHLAAGTITPSSKTISYGTSPGIISVPASTGGICTVKSYQWQKSVDNGTTYTDVNSAITYNNFNPGPLTVKTLFRLKTVCGSETVYSNAITINVNPELIAGTIAPGYIVMTAGDSPGLISGNVASGGNCTAYSYQWQQSTDGITFTNIIGATSQNYSPGMINATSYYKRLVNCGSDQKESNVASFIIPGSTSYNFITTRQITKPGVTTESAADLLSALTDVQQLRQYFDGLGRPVQTIAKQASPLGKDIVQAVNYDQFGREEIKYLPYVSSSVDGNYNLGTSAATQYYASSFNDQFYYSKTFFENSPLNRVYENFAPGNSWVGSGVGVEQQYLFNTATDYVKIWAVTNSATFGSFGTYAVQGEYAAGELYKNITVDEHGKQVIEFKNKEGLVLLKKVQFTAAPDDGTGSGSNYVQWLCTYYIYDDLNQLRAVIQPKGATLLSNNNWDINAISGSILSQTVFEYDYDERGRMIMKRVPGASEVYMVYDARDRLVMTQDANMRASDKWLVTIYENDFNRPIQTELVPNSSFANKTFAQHKTASSTSSAYPYAQPPAVGANTLTITHYDDYGSLPSGLNASLVTTAITATNFYTTYNASPIYAQELIQSGKTRGMVTWTQTKVLGTTSQMLAASSIYDAYGRVIQTQSVNVTGATDIATMQYDFSGKLLRNHLKHEKAGGLTQTYKISTANTYDNGGRLTKVEKMINESGTWKKIAENTYTELSQLKTKKLGVKPSDGVSPLETLTYDYNIRGWLLGTNRSYIQNTTSNYFGFELGYDNANTIVSGTTYTKPEFNGNIAGTVWKSAGDGIIRKFDYDYDAVNRIVSADFNQYSSSSFNKADGIDFSVSNITYDQSGNLKTMKQMGWKVGGSVAIDDFTYTYMLSSNKLRNVIDVYSDPQTTLGDFRYSESYNNTLGGAKLTTATDYTYDANGNMKSDKNKDITNIAYNYLNLPITITITAKGSIEYVYDAAGTKLKKIVHETGKPNKTTLYLAGTYEDDVLQFLPHEEGRIRYNAVTALFNYDYFIKDHLGNVRMTLTEEQQRDVYPAATLEGNINIDGTPNSVYIEKNYYTIDPAYIVPQADATGITAYKNNNGANAPNNNPNSLTGQNSTKLYKLNSNTNKTGLGITLKVMAGDIIDIYGKSYYFQNNVTEQNVSMPLSEIISGFLGSATGVTGGKGATTASVTSLNQSTFPATFFTRTPPAGNVIPNAYINYVFFDEQFKYAGSGYSKAGINGQIKNHITSLDNIVVPKNGYLYVYVSNQSPVDVFFDNLQVIHTRGAILDETHYYPFGLTMAGISSKSAGKMQNREKFNDGTELNEDLGLNWYETDFRSYDSQIGRFLQIDELTEFDFNWSPYVYAYNNPILINDPLGLTGDSANVPKPPTPESEIAGTQVLTPVIVSNKPKSVGQPGTLESMIPIWGSGRAAIDDFQNGRWGWGIFNTVMAVTDIFMVKTALTALLKPVVKDLAKEGVYVITTKSGKYIGQSKNFLKRLTQHFGKNGKLSGQQLKKALLHEMPGSTKLEREAYEQYLIDKNGLDNLINANNPMGGRRDLYNQIIDGVIEKFGLPR